MRSSLGASFVNSPLKSEPVTSLTKNCPVEISRLAREKKFSFFVSWAGFLKREVRKLLEPGSSNVSSVSVPGVTRRVTSLFTTAFDPLFLASAGSSICSTTATLKPALMAFCKYSSATFKGTPAIGMSLPWYVPRLVRVRPNFSEASMASSKKSS